MEAPADDSPTRARQKLRAAGSIAAASTRSGPTLTRPVSQTLQEVAPLCLPVGLEVGLWRVKGRGGRGAYGTTCYRHR